MLMKCLDLSSGRRSYCVGKVLVQYMKSCEGYGTILNALLNFHPMFIPRKAIASRVSLTKAVAESCENKIKTLRKTQSRRKVADEIYDYFKGECPAEILDIIPKKYFRRNRMQSEHLCLVHPNTADIIVECIKKNTAKEDPIILEANPGIGVLSKKLIDAGIRQLHLHEPSPSFQKIIKDFQYQHKEKVTLHHSDFLSLWKIAFQDRMDQGTRVSDILSHYSKKSWVEEPSLVVIGCILNAGFIKYLIQSLVFQSGLMAHCRPEMYLLMTPSLHLRLTCSGKDGYLRYRTISVLFQLFFDYELVEKVPRKDFLPWTKPAPAKKRKATMLSSLDLEWLYLMKIVPKKDLYETIQPEKLPGLWYFVRHHFLSRKRKVISDMESWIPGCGVRLILDGYNIYTEFGDLKPSEVLNIFLRFSSWPEYQDSSFLASMESALMKLYENPDEITYKPEKVDEADDNVDNDQLLQ